MADNELILITGAAGKLGAVGRTVTGLLLDRGLPVRAMVRREDDRATALRAAGAEVVVGDLLEPADVYRVVSGCRRVYFGMSVSGWYLEATVSVARWKPRGMGSIWTRARTRTDHARFPVCRGGEAMPFETLKVEKEGPVLF